MEIKAMMHAAQVDWAGPADGAAEFTDIRRTRDSSAETKAVLCLELVRLVGAIPPRIKCGGSIESVRDWKRERAQCQKVAGNKRASAAELGSAINRMQAWFS